MDLAHVYQRTVDPNGTDSLARLARWITPGSTILELGPATGYFTRYLTETLGCTVDCVEYSEEMAANARPMSRTMIVGDLDQLDLGPLFEPSSYDYVITADVLEHLRNPWRVMEKCRPLLKAGGRFLISIPNVGHAALIAELISGRFDYREEGLLDRTHLRLFTRKSVLEMLQRCGYRLRDLDRVEWMPEQTEFQRDIEACPPKLRDYLLAHPDSLTYQFIVDAEPGEMTDADIEQWLAAAQGPSDPYFIAKVYWGGPDEALDESRCHRQPVHIREERNLIRFDLPVDQPLATVRFDPVDRPGYLDVYRISVSEVDATGDVVNSLVNIESPTALRENSRWVDLIGGDDESGPRLTSVSNDPQIWLEPSEPWRPASGNRLRFEAELSWPRSADYLVAARQYEASYVALKHELDAFKVHEAELERILAETRAKLQSSEQHGEELTEEIQRLSDYERRCRQAESMLNEIHGSRAWKLITRLRRLKQAILRK